METIKELREKIFNELDNYFLSLELDLQIDLVNRYVRNSLTRIIWLNEDGSHDDLNDYYYILSMHSGVVYSEKELLESDFFKNNVKHLKKCYNDIEIFDLPDNIQNDIITLKTIEKFLK